VDVGRANTRDTRQNESNHLPKITTHLHNLFHHLHLHLHLHLHHRHRHPVIPAQERLSSLLISFRLLFLRQASACQIRFRLAGCIAVDTTPFFFLKSAFAPSPWLPFTRLIIRPITLAPAHQRVPIQSCIGWDERLQTALPIYFSLIRPLIFHLPALPKVSKRIMARHHLSVRELDLSASHHHPYNFNTAISDRINAVPGVKTSAGR
jgi:hypothetical protein